MTSEPGERDSAGAGSDGTRIPDAVVSRRAVARHGKLGSPGGGPAAIVKWIAIGIATVVVGLVGVAGLAVAQVYNSFTFDAVVSASGSDAEEQLAIQDLDGGFNLLVVGTDTREGQNGTYTAEDKTSNLADVIILLHVSDDHKSAVAVSFPRDLMVAIPSCPKEDGSGNYAAMSKQQINSSIDYGGVYCTVLTIENLTGLSIPYYTLIDFNGVIEMSNAVGGVSVCVTDAVNDPESGLNIPAGESVLKGDQALAFLRTRHGFGDSSDLSRISAQQVYLSSLMRTVTSAGTLTNPFKLYGLAAAAAENLKLSATMSSPATMMSMAAALATVDLDKMVFIQAPTVADPQNSNRVVLASTATEVFQYIAEDRSLVFGDGDTVGRGAVSTDSSSAAASSEASSESASSDASSSSSASSESASASDDSAVLPSGVTGQTADDQTCALAAG